MNLRYEDFQPQDWQERHSPTESVVVKGDGGEVFGICRRRIKDSRIWDKVEYWHLEREAIRICRAFHFITFGRGCRTSKMTESFERSGLESFLSDLDFLHYLIRCRKDYLKWAEECGRQGVNRAAVVDLLYFNMTIAQVESKFHKKHGWAIKNLIKGLRLYI